MKKGIAAVALSLLFTGCSTITIHPDNMSKLSNEPDYETSRDFFIGGLVGNHKVDVDTICGENGVRQMQTQATAKDGLLTAITLGIYSPHSIKVWCNK